jgi:predicted phosphodiesterase
MQSKNPIALCCADLHMREDQPLARTDNYQETQWGKFLFLLSVAESYVIPVLCAGDFFHKSKVSKQFEKKIIRQIEQSGIDFYILPGNHDLPYHSLEHLNNSSLGILELSEKIYVPEIELDTMHEIDSVGKIKIGMIHSLIHRDTPLIVDGKTISTKAKTILKKYPECDVIISGDNHESFIVEHEGRILINPGSMMRMTAAQIEHRPSMTLLYDDLSYEVIYFPIEKGVIDRTHIDKKHNYDERMEKFINKITDREKISISYEENLYNYMRANKVRKPVEEIILEVVE